MCQALRELMKDEIQKDVEAGILKGRAEGIATGRAEGIAKGRAEGIQALVDVYRKDLGLDDQTIIGKLADRFHLTGEQAKEFVFPHAVSYSANETFS